MRIPIHFKSLLNCGRIKRFINLMNYVHGVYIKELIHVDVRLKLCLK